MATRAPTNAGADGDSVLIAVRTGYLGSPVIEPHGEVDFSNRGELATALAAALEMPSMLVFLDLRWLRFLDSSGLHVICKTDQEAVARGKRLMIVRGLPAVQRVFELTRLEDRLTFIEELPGQV